MELTKEYFDQQLSLLNAGIEELPTKSDFAALKQTVHDIQETVNRIDKRSDEDVRAAYWDIEQIKKRLHLKPAA